MANLLAIKSSDQYLFLPIIKRRLLIEQEW